MKTKGTHRAAPRPAARVIDASARLGSAPATLQPPSKGRLYYDFEIPDAFLEGLPGIKNKVRWVREHLPRATCKKIGRQSAWYEADIRAFVDSLSRGDAAGAGGDAQRAVG
ncbi:MAG TPA: hypothetical protein VFS08_02255 [Gemmatimonadaceae bacterium]|nr:hypothetical protein [Gemmatimonadaceae bacterium]